MINITGICNPTVYIKKIKVPVLAINGTLDLQVLPHNLYKFEKALQEGGNKNYTIKMFDNKSHVSRCYRGNS